MNNTLQKRKTILCNNNNNNTTNNNMSLLDRLNEEQMKNVQD